MNAEQTVTTAYCQLLDQSTNPRQRTSLERIKAACDYLDANGLKVSPASVERYCLDRQWDGPKAQSMRNSKNVLMRYLQLRQSSQKWHKPAKAGSGEPDIADESIRAYVQLLREERDQAVAEKARIEAGLRKLPGISVDQLLRGTAEGGPTVASATPPELRDALKTLCDSGRLEACGLELFKGRLRQVTTKNVLLEKQHMDAVSAALVG
ncbi:hypothetical protein [Delftia tsuruhatensis]|jgi:hypothetical protein|uniref:hypothetical protein n=1 Tax=Delftia tsuruhatensis TaxID=180282 RepID=UPI001247D0D2|nr:hypothetical protein F3K36_11640 [Delftia sp. BR1]